MSLTNHPPHHPHNQTYKPSHQNPPLLRNQATNETVGEHVSPEACQIQSRTSIVLRHERVGRLINYGDLAISLIHFQSHFRFSRLFGRRSIWGEPICIRSSLPHLPATSFRRYTRTRRPGAIGAQLSTVCFPACVYRAFWRAPRIQPSFSLITARICKPVPPGIQGKPLPADQAGLKGMGFTPDGAACSCSVRDLTWRNDHACC